MSGNPFSTPAVPGNGGTFSGQMGAPPVPGGNPGPGQIGGDVGKQYYNTDPQSYWATIVGKLGGPTSPLGQFAQKRFSDAWSKYIQASTTNPTLAWKDFADQNFGGGQLGQQYATTSPFQRDPYNQPSWAPGRFLG